MSETPCQPSQQENGHFVTDPADIATETAMSNPEQDTTASKREEVSQFSPHAHSAEERGLMSETPDDEFAPGFPERLKDIIRGGAVIMTDWNNTETAPDATQSADNSQPAVTTLPEPTPAEKAVSGAAMRKEWGGYPTLKEYQEAQAKRAGDTVSGAMQARIAPNGEYIPLGAEWSEQEQRVVPMQLVVENLDTVMRACNKADDEAHATGTEAQVCADIAKRQRKGIAKYRNTVANNPLTFARWLQHMYEELLDASVYAKRILTMMNHEPENRTDSDRNADGVQPASDPVVQRHRKPGAGRKAKPCPGCGAVKSIGSTVKNRIPTRRCKVCGFVVQTYPHLVNAAKAPA